MPVLVRMLINHALIGFGIAAIFVAGLIWFDMGGLGTLILSSDSGWLALFMLTFFLGLTFGSAQMGFAIMSGDWDGKDSGRRGKRQRVQLHSLKLAAVKVRLSR